MLANFLNSQSTANKEKEAQWSTVERDDEKKNTHTGSDKLTKSLRKATELRSYLIVRWLELREKNEETDWVGVMILT